MVKVCLICFIKERQNCTFYAHIDVVEIDRVYEWNSVNFKQLWLLISKAMTASVALFIVRNRSTLYMSYWCGIISQKRVFNSKSPYFSALYIQVTGFLFLDFPIHIIKSILDYPNMCQSMFGSAYSFQS